jgi:hypothetical protein
MGPPSLHSTATGIVPTIIIIIIIINQTILVSFYKQCLLPQNNTEAKPLADTCSMNRLY